MGGPGADEVVGRYLGTQVEALVALAPAVRSDAPDAVHRMRVAARRLRSAIACFQPLLERRRTEPVRADLRLLGKALAPVRDSEVLLAYFTAVDPEPAVLLVRESLGRDHALAHARLVTEMDGGRHEALVRSLRQMLDPSPFRPGASAPADLALPPLLERAEARVRLAAALAVAVDESARDDHLHEVRKLSKRARYAADAAAPAVGPRAEALAAAMSATQDALGQHQDSVQAIRVLLSVRATLPGRHPDVHPAAFDRLLDVERARGKAALAAYDHL